MLTTQNTSSLSPALRRIFHILCCPQCKSGLSIQAARVTCLSCDGDYAIKNGKIYFTSPPKRDDVFDGIKETLRRHMGSYYYTIGRDIFSPIYLFDFYKYISSKIHIEDADIIVDIGSGDFRISEKIITVDCMDYKNVDIVCDILNLPFKDNTIYCFVSRGLIEHVENPEQLITELYRATRNNGYSIHLIPFIFPFHASPYDYTRYTAPGQHILFKKFSIIEQDNPQGPVSVLLYFIIDFLSLLLAFGNNTIKSYIFLILCLLLFPIKFFDIFFAFNEKYMHISPNIVSVARKDHSIDTCLMQEQL